MAGVFMRRRNLIFKFIIGVPILWFSFIGFMVVMSGGGIPDINAVDGAGGAADARYRRSDTRLKYDGEKLSDVADNVMEVPNPERMQFEQRIRLEAEQQEAEDRGDEGRRRLNVAAGEEHNRDNNIPVRTRLKPLPTTRINNKTRLVYEPHEVVFHLPPDDADGPGSNGKSVVIDKQHLSPKEKEKFDTGWKKNAFNQYASDMISLHRTLPDVRDKGCKRISYRPVEKLPDTSVIICFHNEAWTVLLRTVHSVLDRSPPSLVKEIILVDDFSDMAHLKQPLVDYMEKLLKVRVVRTKRREGLIRARLLGASVAQGDVLTYLDSHCEAAEGWLEPLLDRIAANKSNVVTPVIDVIDDETLKYQFSSAQSTSVGGFDWNLQFNWHGIPSREKKRRKSPIDPVRSPTMAGGLFSISREYFEYIGSYDPGMDIWGGENLEMSFRIWMCGGSLEIIPCSHVGHIFRKRSPYSWKTGVNVVKKNSVRLAEVWMDDYKKYYYERFNFDLGSYGDVSARKALRERLQCKSFDWFIRNIYPELFIPGDAVASGEIRNKNQPRCLDSPVDKHSMNKAVKMWPCHKQGGNQYWMLSKDGEIRRDEGCMDYAGQFVMMYPCHGMKGNQEWAYDSDGSLRHKNSNLCIEMSVDGQKVEMRSCNGSDRQRWQWKRKSPDQHR